jgi:hypothetical protein
MIRGAVAIQHKRQAGPHFGTGGSRGHGFCQQRRPSKADKVWRRDDEDPVRALENACVRRCGCRGFSANRWNVDDHKVGSRAEPIEQIQDERGVD